MESLKLKNLKLSLKDLVGNDYIESVCKSKAFIENMDENEFYSIANEKVEFFPDSFSQRMDELLEFVGKQVSKPLQVTVDGSATKSFKNAANNKKAPLSSIGFIRIGEDGKAYLASKSEHYQASLGHNFPGYKLIENAKKLGIPNATHNSTRGYITRLLETEIVRIANGIEKGDSDRLKKIITSGHDDTLNRVLNLETGSLAVEAAFKMMLSRFYRLDSSYPEPKYSGKIPVFLVMSDYNGGKEANYHGTTVFAQILRGMWPDLYSTFEKNDVIVVQQVKINNLDDFKEKVKKFDHGKHKIAGFFHEIILMNYGGIKLEKSYLQNVYAICKKRDIPIIADEIQSCIWSPEVFMFKEYGLKPDFVSIGKGFPGGEYPASKLLTTPAMDNLNLFGALVTNGQEELASLAYLITMTFVEENKDYILKIGDYYENSVRQLKEKYYDIVDKVEGSRHLLTLFFKSIEETKDFVSYLDEKCIDISAQTYKINTPPSALTKIPLISSKKMVDFLVDNIEDALKFVRSKKNNNFDSEDVIKQQKAKEPVEVV